LRANTHHLPVTGDAWSDVRARSIIEERERLARELHDGLAQLLGCVIAKAAAGRMLLESGDVTSAEKQLREIEDVTHELYSETREAILGLKASGGVGGNFQTELQKFIAHFIELSGLQVELETSPEVGTLPLPLETEVHLLRIVQEALSNVRRHASASRISITVLQEGGSLLVEVCDNGIGIAASQDSGGTDPHFGLEVMRDRAELIGGALQVESSAGLGTRIRVICPSTGE
jgi:signal transduction histidine kinase